MTIYNAIMAFTGWMWGLPMLVVLIGGGLWITVSCDFVQVKHLGQALKHAVGNALHGDKGEGKITGYQAMTACLANTIGTGNIVGVGSAIALGGPGAVFWMWVIGFIAMALKYSEAVMGVHTRTKDENGKWKGGASRYLSSVWKPLGLIWGIAALYGMAIGCGAHTGSVGTAAAQFGIPTTVTTIIIAAIVAAIIFGGVKTLVKITDKLVPVMTLIYVGAGLVVILLNIGNLIPAIGSIFAGAFTGTAATGGFVGASLSAAIRNGASRGVYSSDAGNGSASILHAQADTNEPVEQGMMGIFEVFVDTIIVCSFTALIILTTQTWTTGDAGSVLAINAFSQTLGSVGKIISSCGLLLFALSSILSMTSSVGLLAKEMFNKYVGYAASAAVFLAVLAGGTVGVDAFLSWVDFANMIMIVLNVGGMLFLTKELRKLTRGYFSKAK